MSNPRLFSAAQEQNDNNKDRMMAAYIGPQIDVIDSEYKKLKALYEAALIAYSKLQVCSTLADKKVALDSCLENIAVIDRLYTSLNFYNSNIVNHTISRETNLVEVLEKNLKGCRLWAKEISEDGDKHEHVKHLGETLAMFDTIVSKANADRKSALVLEYHDKMTPEPPVEKKKHHRCNIL